MSLDYDIVIIGNTLEAFFAASEAIKFNPRVALVLGDFNNEYWQEIDSLIVNYLTYIERHWHNLNNWYLNINLDSWLDFNQLKKWKNEVKEDIKQANNLEKLANLGVDIIEESGEFCRLPKLGFVLKNRTLRSRRYLLAMGSISNISDIQGLKEVGYITPETLDIDKLPDKLVILSQNALGIELAQQLNRLGKTITLIIEKSSILPQEDPDITQLIQAILEAEGINLLINCPVTQIRKIEGKKWIQAGNEAIEGDEIIIDNQTQFKIKELNLEGVKVKIEGNKIKTNNRLQTTNPNIYACGQAIGSYNLSNLACYEAGIAVKNAIFYPIFKTNYEHYLMRMLTNPMFSRVGLTETQAKQFYKEDLIIIKQNYKSLVKAKILDETTGFCKVITRRNGIILGCHIIGYQSDETINLIALAIQNKLKIQKIAQLFPLYGTTSEMLSQISQKWQEQKQQKNTLINNCLETLLFWRRKWNK
ncbi:FAD-dependent oxidoreductase [Crocosphaera sp.]|uniref:FAD-dependent oxidoreductase n=1 Tax=Crocosphaera sp. TaxID=2729996 RepID=UPI00260731E5|nr:FAD-dependent oxidoreductase [Crocosphaera sp.]MDJ0579274.1 FAD-dependent oxidoreductase [Crocosphaera sp.]